MNPSRGSTKRYRSSEADSSSQPEEVVPAEKIAPYVEPREPSMLNRPFSNRKQLSIYNDILKQRENMYVPQVKSIDVEYMQRNERYFTTSLSLYDKLSILNIMQFSKDFDAELVDVFSDTVHLGTVEARTVTWMTNGRFLFSP
ncbi:hypothetical protein D1007_40497 [Hordeum vulgare]|nr:hypothetical protein D1007_40497 [Hordeum vulgare]